MRFYKEARKFYQAIHSSLSLGPSSRIILIRLAWQHRLRRSFLRPFATCFAPGVGETLLVRYECPSHTLFPLLAFAHLSKSEEILLQLLPLGRGLLALPPDELEHLDSPLAQLSVVYALLLLSLSLSFSLLQIPREGIARRTSHADTDTHVNRQPRVINAFLNERRAGLRSRTVTSYDAALFTVRSDAVFTVNARTRALRYTPPAHVDVPCLFRYYSPASGCRVDRSRSFLLPRALATRRISSRSRTRDVSADSRVYHRSRIRDGMHPPLGRSVGIAVQIRRGGAQVSRSAGRKRATHATERRTIETHGQRRRARAITPRRSLPRLSLAVVSASTFPPSFRRAAESSAPFRPRSTALGRPRPRSAPRRRARPNEQ